MGQWETIERAFANVTDAGVRNELQGMLEGGDIRRGLGLLTRMRGGDFAAATFGHIEAVESLVGYNPGDIAFTLVHEWAHLQQPFFAWPTQREKTRRELEADRIGCASTTGRVIFAFGGYGGCR